MALSDTDAQKRSNLLGRINEALAEVDIADQRISEAQAKYNKVLNDLKSEKGTAQAMKNKAVKEYDRLRRKLEALMPSTVTDVSGDEDQVMLAVDAPAF